MSENGKGARSAELQDALRAVERCQVEMRTLKHRAINGRDIWAALALFDIATDATRTLHDLWFDLPAPSLSFDPPPQNSRIEQRHARREMLHFFKSECEFPVLQPLGSSERARRKPPHGALDSRQAEILRWLRFGPTRSAVQKRNRMGIFLGLIVVPLFQDIQYRPTCPKGIEGKIWALPPLTLETRGEWAGVIVDWCCERHASLMEREGKLYSLVKPERELARDLRKRRKALKALRKEWARLRKEYAERKKAAHDKLAVSATNLISAQQNIREAQNGINAMGVMGVTREHIKDGLRERITEYWRRHLAPTDSGERHGEASATHRSRRVGRQKQAPSGSVK